MMSDAIQVHALRLLTHQHLDPSARNLTLARRRVLAAGRLADLGGHMAPGLMRVRTVEHGGPDAMSPGAMFAECWLDARDEAEWRQRSRDLLELEAVALTRGIRLTVAIYRATPWDSRLESLAWLWARVVG